MKASVHPVHNVNDGLFTTVNHLTVDLLNPKPEMISIYDISIALANIIRFGGHSKIRYTVAQHSVLVSKLAPPELKFAALMHDAAEAYLGDVIKPLKVILGAKYHGLEEQFEDVIFTKYEVCKEQVKLIKPYDNQALEMEHKMIRLNDDSDMPLGFKIPWTFEQSQSYFEVAFFREATNNIREFLKTDKELPQ